MENPGNSFVVKNCKQQQNGQQTLEIVSNGVKQSGPKILILKKSQLGADGLANLLSQQSSKFKIIQTSSAESVVKALSSNPTFSSPTTSAAQKPNNLVTNFATSGISKSKIGISTGHNTVSLAGDTPSIKTSNQSQQQVIYIQKPAANEIKIENGEVEEENSNKENGHEIYQHEQVIYEGPNGEQLVENGGQLIPIEQANGGQFIQTEDGQLIQTEEVPQVEGQEVVTEEQEVMTEATSNDLDVKEEAVEFHIEDNQFEVGEHVEFVAGEECVQEEVVTDGHMDATVTTNGGDIGSEIYLSQDDSMVQIQEEEIISTPSAETEMSVAMDLAKMSQGHFGAENGSSEPTSTTATNMITNVSGDLDDYDDDGAARRRPVMDLNEANTSLDPAVISALNDAENAGSQHMKPRLSYAQLIAEALISAPERMLTLSEIYLFISRKHPYYRMDVKSWQNAIRHNLTLNPGFKKVPRPNNEGRGNFWRIEDGAEQTIFKRIMRNHYSRRSLPYHSTGNTPYTFKSVKNQYGGFTYVLDGTEFIEEVVDDEQSRAIQTIQIVGDNGEEYVEESVTAPNDDQFQLPINGGSTNNIDVSLNAPGGQLGQINEEGFYNITTAGTNESITLQKQVVQSQGGGQVIFIRIPSKK